MDLDEPLRWRGILRADPLRLPWGFRYDIDLEQVQSAGEWRAVHGRLARELISLTNARREFRHRFAPENAWKFWLGRGLVRNFGDPGAFDYRGALQQQGIDLTATLRNPALMQNLPGPAPKFSHYLARLRGRLLNDLDAMLSPAEDRAAIARAMLLGDRSFLDSQQAESFRETGAFHVLVVAGLHVGVLAAFLFWAGKKLRLPIAARALPTIAALGFYVAIIEDRPPIMRAALMATIYLLARMLYRRVALLNAVSLAAVVILLFRPSEIAQASFQLSFLAAGNHCRNRGTAAGANRGALSSRTRAPWRCNARRQPRAQRRRNFALIFAPSQRGCGRDCRQSWRNIAISCGSSLPRWPAAVGIGRALRRSANRHASADGARFSSSLVYSAGCKHPRRAAHWHHRAIWVRSAGCSAPYGKPSESFWGAR